MSNAFINLAHLGLIVGMVAYHGRLYFRHRLAYRLAFLAFWVTLAVEFFSEDQWLLAPAVACLVYGIWRRRRVGKDIERWLSGDGTAGEASL